MLRTNPSFLSFIESLYEQQVRKEDIVLKTFTKSSLLVTQGSKATRVLIVKEGITKCFFSEENGKDYIVEFLAEGEILGEIEAIRNIPCLCSVEAITKVRAYVLNIAYFRSLLEKDLALNRMLLDEMAERLINTASRSSAQQLYTIEHGLRKILALQSKLNIAISKEDMAAYLGVTLRSLNRALKNLQ